MQTAFRPGPAFARSLTNASTTAATPRHAECTECGLRLASGAVCAQCEDDVGGESGGGGGAAGVVHSAAAPSAKLLPHGAKVMELRNSAHRRAMANRILDERAQAKFWLEVLPEMLTEDLFSKLFANFESGVFHTTFNIRQAIDDSAPPKNEDVCDVKATGVQNDSADYDVDLYWVPVRLTKNDFIDGPPNKDFFTAAPAYAYEGNPEYAPVMTDFYRLQFSVGIQDHLISEIHPHVRARAQRLFSSFGFELKFPGPNDPCWVHLLVLKGRKTLQQWRDYWTLPVAGREVFTVELKSSTSGDPLQGAPGYEEALKRPAVKLERSIAEEEAEANRVAKEKRDKKNAEAEALMARVAGRALSPVKSVRSLLPLKLPASPISPVE